MQCKACFKLTSDVMGRELCTDCYGRQRDNTVYLADVETDTLYDIFAVIEDSRFIEYQTHKQEDAPPKADNLLWLGWFKFRVDDSSSTLHFGTEYGEEKSITFPKKGTKVCTLNSK